MLDLLHDEGTLKGGDVVMPAKDVEEELLVGAHVGGMDAEKVVEAAGDVVALGDFAQAADHLGEGIGTVGIELTELDAAEDGEAKVDLVGIDDGGILADEAKAFKTFHALVRGRGGKMYLGGQFLVGEPGILLKNAQDVNVLVVQFV